MLSYIVAKRIFNKNINKEIIKINRNMWETKDFIQTKITKDYINYYKTPEFKKYKPNLKN